MCMYTQDVHTDVHLTLCVCVVEEQAVRRHACAFAAHCHALHLHVFD